MVQRAPGGLSVETTRFRRMCDGDDDIGRRGRHDTVKMRRLDPTYIDQAGRHRWRSACLPQAALHTTIQIVGWCSAAPPRTSTFTPPLSIRVRLMSMEGGREEGTAVLYVSTQTSVLVAVEMDAAAWVLQAKAPSQFN